MGNFITDIKYRYFSGAELLFRLLIINIGVFLVATVWLVFTTLFNVSGMAVVSYLELPSSFLLFAMRPWSIITYMFLHTDFLHLLFNMLWLYWFGRMFLSRFTSRQLVGVYLLGGIAGGLTYMLAYNLFPYFEPFVSQSFLLGASASVLAIVVATAVVIPDYTVFLLFLGAVKLKYIAIFAVALSFFNITSANAGGDIAHLGGALFGLIYARLYLKGFDLAKGINRIIDFFATIFTPRPKMRVKMGQRQRDMDYNASKKQRMDEIDAILDKIKRCGYEGLTSEEKKKLFNAGKK